MAEDLLQFLRLASGLKHLRRRGWIQRGVPHAESVADHTFSTCLMALVLCPRMAPELDRDRCVRLALVHDLAEAIVGDITPRDGLSKADKRRREEAAVKEMCRSLDDDELLDLWREFEMGETPEARFVRDLDTAEMVLQAVEYQREHGDAVELADFCRRGSARIRADHLIHLVQDALAREA